MVRAADRPQPVQRGDPKPGHRVGVRGSAGRSVAEFESQLGTQRPGPFHQHGRRLRLLHRREPRHRDDLHRRVGDALRLGDHLNGRHRFLERRKRRCPDVDLELAPLGHDVRPGSALHDADVDGDAWPPAVQLVQGDGGSCGLQRRRTPPLGLHARVRGPAMNDDPKIRHALAGRDDVAVLSRAFQDEADVRLFGALQDVRPAER